MYLNIILTLIFLAYALNLLTNLSYGKYQVKEHEKARDYNKKVNDEVLELHWKMVEELEKLNGKVTP